jgi:hypothetical protein
MIAAQALPLAALAIVLPWSIYRRIRRSIGPQLLAPRRLKARVAFLLLVLALLGGSWLRAGQDFLLAALAAGAIGGIAVAAYAVRRTRFERKDGLDYYVPNARIGLTLSALLIARIVYRMVQLYPLLLQPGGPPPEALQSMSTPLTGALIGLVLGYYLAYCIGVLRHPSRPAPEPAPAAP